VRYILGLGSNINPDLNTIRMISAICDLGDDAALSRIVATEPVGVAGDQFLNTAMSLRCPLPPDDLKDQLRQIEADLGRDMDDPNRKKRSRPADIDILLVLHDDDQTVAPTELPTEEYLRPQVLELLAFLGVHTSVPIPVLPPGTPLPYGDKRIGAEAGLIGRQQ
jgi:2-amino-4-hydroxy-6-hydroxymethyldihydropteridine diphosphokinase